MQNSTHRGKILGSNFVPSPKGIVRLMRNTKLLVHEQSAHLVGVIYKIHNNGLVTMKWYRNGLYYALVPEIGIKYRF